MPKVKSKIKLSLYLSPANYWCVQYIKALTNRNASEVIEEAVKYTIRRINDGDPELRKPKVPQNPVRQNVYLTRDTFIAAGTIKIDKEMFGWSNTDFARYGLRHTLASYMTRYPEMKKIVNMYQ